MPHMVVFRTKEGKPGYHLADSLDDAVRFVEHLRNNEQLADSKIYRMHEVPIEFKVLYKAEVAGGAPAPATPASPASPGEDSAPAEALRTETAAAPAAEPAATTSRAQDRTEPVRSVAPTRMRTTAAPTPVAQTGGRFGLFSRA